MDASALRTWSPYADVVETHISTVMFSGDRAYKKLKPVKTAFLDYSTPEARHRAASRELMLNSRLAPDTYLGLAHVFELDEATDTMIVMARMPDDSRLTQLLDGPQAHDALRTIARRIAAFHAQQPSTPEAIAAASSSAERERWETNLAEMRSTELGDVLDAGMLDEIEQLAMTYLSHRDALFVARGRSGMACDGHGDLLADDIFITEDGPQILDCLAFDDSLRLGDVLADIAFLVMDIERLAGEQAAALVMRYYQEFSNEHHPTSLAHFYVAYRALVRAKVAALRHVQEPTDACAELAQGHLLQCRDHLRRSQLMVVAVGGGPGTGKSTLAEAIGSALRCAVLRTDEIRKAKAGLAPTDAAPAEPDAGIYQDSATQATYAEMLAEAETLLRHGESVVLDASWSSAEHRGALRHLASELGASLSEVECTLPTSVAKERIVRRSASPWNVSDATAEIVDHMADRHDPWPEALQVDTSGSKQACRALAMRRVLRLSMPAQPNSRPHCRAEPQVPAKGAIAP